MSKPFLMYNYTSISNYFQGFPQTLQNYSGHILCCLYTLCLCVLNYLQFEANSHSNYIWQFILQQLMWRRRCLGLHFLCSFSICNTGRAPVCKCWAHNCACKSVICCVSPVCGLQPAEMEGTGQRLGRRGQQRGGQEPRRAPGRVLCWRPAPALRLHWHKSS